MNVQVVVSRREEVTSPLLDSWFALRAQVADSTSQRVAVQSRVIGYGRCHMQSGKV
jgi:hypothetical protein